MVATVGYHLALSKNTQNVTANLATATKIIFVDRKFTSK